MDTALHTISVILEKTQEQCVSRCYESQSEITSNVDWVNRATGDVSARVTRLDVFFHRIILEFILFKLHEFE